MRNMAPEHQDFVFAHFGDPDVHRYLVDAEPVRSVADAAEIVAFYASPEQRLRNRWVLTLRADAQPIGTLGFHAFDQRNRAIEVGYDLSPAYWGRGLMSEALGAGLEHVFTGLGVHRVEAWVHIANRSSATLLERHAFVREGTVRAKYFFDGDWHDHDLYSLLEEDRS